MNAIPTIKPARITKTKTTTKPKARRRVAPPGALLAMVQKVLDDGKAEDVVVLDLMGRSSIADQMVVATGRSSRQVVALAEHLLDALKNGGYGRAQAEGLAHGDWVLVDAGDVLVHIFRPEVRDYYNIEKMWSPVLGEPALKEQILEEPALTEAVGTSS